MKGVGQGLIGLARRNPHVQRLGARVRRMELWLREVTLRPYYRRRLKAPVDGSLAVFNAYWYRGYGCNPAAVYRAARRLVPGLRGVWVVTPGGVASLPEDVEHVVAGSRAYYDVIARAKVFVGNVNFPDEVVKREGTVHVMTHHGTPLKLMATDLRGRAIPEAQIDFEGLARRCARWDYSVSSNAHSTQVWGRVYPGAYETLEVGYPRNDLLANATRDTSRQARSGLGIDSHERVVLYAPTFRDDESGYVERLDLVELAGRLGEGWTWLSRLHHIYAKDPFRGRPTGPPRVIDVSGHPSIETLCLAADVLITDYSSVLFDYAVLDRPIVIHAPDWERYRAERGTYFDLLAEPPGVVTRTLPEVETALRMGLVDDDAARSLRAAFRSRFCAFDQGDAAERVVRRAWSLDASQP